MGSLLMTAMWGIRRGLFSNEAGQGSAPIAHATAKTKEPVREGLVASLGPFIDTLMICTMTGLAIVTTGVFKDRVVQPLDLSSIEAVSVQNAPAFAIGIQWHPEWKALENPHSRRLFQAFGNACRAYASQKAAAPARGRMHE